jgi:hypothetical protein
LSAAISVKKLIGSLGGNLLRRDQGQALAEYAAMLGLVLSLLFLVRMIGFNANRVFQWVANSFQ